MRFLLLLAVASTALVHSSARGDDDPRTRTFPDKKCRYTLPGPEWRWVDSPAADTLCLAADDRGAVVTLGAMEGDAPIDDAFIAGFERGCLKSPLVKKRGGRKLDFLGLPCYQLEAVSSDGRTMTSRVFIAHGMGYSLNCIGGKEPIENDPRFEKMLAGFSFAEQTNVAAPKAKATRTEMDSGTRIGELAGGIVVMVVVVILCLRIRS